jgi:hypothetical protein
LSPDPLGCETSEWALWRDSHAISFPVLPTCPPTGRKQKPALKHGSHAICYMNGQGFVAATSMKLEGRRSRTDFSVCSRESSGRPQSASARTVSFPLRRQRRLEFAIAADLVRRGCQSRLVFPKPTAPSIFRRDGSTFEKLARIFFQQAAVIQQLFRISEVAYVQNRPATKKEFPQPYKIIRSQPAPVADLHFGCVVDEVNLGVSSFEDQVILPGLLILAMNEYPALYRRQLAHIEYLDWESLVRYRDAMCRERLLAITVPLHGPKNLFDVVPYMPGVRRR